MFSLEMRKALPLVAAAVVFSFFVPQTAAAANPNASADVTFTASGTFSSTPVSGADTLLLRGQPFNISIVANSSLTPSQHLKNWALFTPLNMTGTVNSGLLPNEPIPVSASTAAIYQANGTTSDVFQAGFPVEVIGIALTARAYITMPGGTITTPLIRPFSSVALNPTNATISYSNGTATTVLAVQTGTLVATIPTGNTVAGKALPIGVDQLKAVRPLFGDPAELFAFDAVHALDAPAQNGRVMLTVGKQTAQATRIHLQ